MTEYKCGHNGKPVFLDYNELSYLAYEEWRTTKGYDGDKSMCFPCWYNNKESVKEDEDEN